jgi:hypothetical protein
LWSIEHKFEHYKQNIAEQIRAVVTEIKITKNQQLGLKGPGKAQTLTTMVRRKPIEKEDKTKKITNNQQLGLKGPGKAQTLTTTVRPKPIEKEDKTSY